MAGPTGGTLVGLISGGKDSIFNLLICHELGYNLEVLGHIRTASHVGEEIDSYMYQTVGSNVVERIAECMELPLVVRELAGTPLCIDSVDYRETAGDEVEDLYQLLTTIKERFPNVKYVSTGAIWSNYQKARVEHVCGRLGLVSVSYMWMLPQSTLLSFMCLIPDFDVRLIKIASMGLQKEDLGKSLKTLAPKLQTMEREFGFNSCGEGGEYESVVVDCGLFEERKLSLGSTELVALPGDNPIAPVAHLRLHHAGVIPKLQVNKQTSLLSRFIAKLLGAYILDATGQNMQALVQHTASGEDLVGRFALPSPVACCAVVRFTEMSSHLSLKCRSLSLWRASFGDSNELHSTPQASDFHQALGSSSLDVDCVHMDTGPCLGVVPHSGEVFYLDSDLAFSQQKQQLVLHKTLAIQTVLAFRHLRNTLIERKCPLSSLKACHISLNTSLMGAEETVKNVVVRCLLRCLRWNWVQQKGNRVNPLVQHQQQYAALWKVVEGECCNEQTRDNCRDGGANKFCCNNNFEAEESYLFADTVRTCDTAFLLRQFYETVQEQQAHCDPQAFDLFLGECDLHWCIHPVPILSSSSRPPLVALRGCFIGPSEGSR